MPALVITSLDRHFSLPTLPLLHVCGSLDPALGAQTRVVEKRFKELGGSITVIMKEGEGHYPLAPRNPKPVVDFIVGKAN